MKRIARNGVELGLESGEIPETGETSGRTMRETVPSFPFRPKPRAAGRVARVGLLLYLALLTVLVAAVCHGVRALPAG
jgi:hypothetical protein